MMQGLQLVIIWKKQRLLWACLYCIVLLESFSSALQVIMMTRMMTSPTAAPGSGGSSTSNAISSSILPPAHWLQTPDESLRNGQWFKLICGASLQDLPMVRNLALVYTLAGANCVDVAAEEAVIEAAYEGITTALELAQRNCNKVIPRPWLMMSVNDDEADPHFRKVAFDPATCPVDCPRPCEQVCPADAICFSDSLAARSSTPRLAAMVEQKLERDPLGGVLTSRCYGCGRCMDVCPLGLIKAVPYVRTTSSILSLLDSGLVQAMEIHTKGNLNLFKQAWQSIGLEAYKHLRLIAVSFPDLGKQETPLAMFEWAELMEHTRQQLTSSSSSSSSSSPSSTLPLHIWQTDGRPMSGDIGIGAAAAAVKFAHRVVTQAPSNVNLGDGVHFVQLAGGTNANTVPKLQLLLAKDETAKTEENGGSLRSGRIGGVAYGGYARKIVKSILDSLPSSAESGEIEDGKLEDFPEALEQAVKLAKELMRPLKEQGKLS